MKINEFMNGLPSDQVRVMMGGQVSVWSNAACKGYCVAAMKAADLTAEQTAAVLAELRNVFDCYSVEEAEQIR